MRLYLLRHGIAERSQPGRPDSERRLTEEGRQKLRYVLERARAAKASVGAILSSPYARAIETARIAQEMLGCTGKIVETAALVPSSSPVEVWQLLRDHTDEDAVLLVGHEPLFSALASFLLGAPGSVLEVKKGALACFEVETPGRTPRAVLRWLLTPRLAAPPDHEPA